MQEENKNDSFHLDLDKIKILKSEVLNELHHKKQKKLHWGSAVVTVVLVVLALLSIVQTIQSASILSKVKSGAIKPVSATSSEGATLPSSLENLPNMVGGC